MKKFLAMLLVVLMALALVACQPKPVEPDKPDQSAEPAQSDEPVQSDEPEPTATPEPVVRPETFEALDDEEVYEKVLGKYNELLQASKALENTIDQRFMMQAQAEAYLLNSGVMIPTTTQGGAYAITRIAYRTVPYVQWGNDDDRFFGLVISGDKEFLTKEEREEMKGLWGSVKQIVIWHPHANASFCLKFKSDLFTIITLGHTLFVPRSVTVELMILYLSLGIDMSDFSCFIKTVCYSPRLL